MKRSQFEHDIDELRASMLEMGALVDRMLANAVKALVSQDIPLAERVLLDDDAVDDLDLHIESSCIRIIALQQPNARDLRLVGTVFKVITDLERIGDHAVDIAKVARKLAHAEFRKTIVDIPKIADAARSMLREALEAFVKHDLSLVEHVIRGDDEVDRLFHLYRGDLHAAMKGNPDDVVEASYLLFVCHYLERVSDHAVNIAERVAYVETGELEQLAKSHKSN